MAEPLSHEFLAARWNHVYESRDVSSRSWFQVAPTVSLELISPLGLSRAAALVDVGSGEGRLVDQLLRDGYDDVTILDVSVVGLDLVSERLGPDSRVTYLVEDVRTWTPQRTYELWHDRAVFHFLSIEEARDYRRVLLRALAPGGWVILGAFALDGPESCSGLPVTRYDEATLSEFLGDEFGEHTMRYETHTTPSGAPQSFVWMRARRIAG